MKQLEVGDIWTAQINDPFPPWYTKGMNILIISITHDKRIYKDEELRKSQADFVILNNGKEDWDTIDSICEKCTYNEALTAIHDIIT